MLFTKNDLSHDVTLITINARFQLKEPTCLCTGVCVCVCVLIVKKSVLNADRHEDLGICLVVVQTSSHFSSPSSYSILVSFGFLAYQLILD